MPDLILMDVVMPNLNGFQATRTIAKDPKTSHIPMILVTTKDQETDKRLGHASGREGLRDQADRRERELTRDDQRVSAG